jgi:hypothetical protein
VRKRRAITARKGCAEQDDAVSERINFDFDDLESVKNDKKIETWAYQ